MGFNILKQVRKGTVFDYSLPHFINYLLEVIIGLSLFQNHIFSQIVNSLKNILMFLPNIINNSLIWKQPHIIAVIRQFSGTTEDTTLSLFCEADVLRIGD